MIKDKKGKLLLLLLIFLTFLYILYQIYEILFLMTSVPVSSETKYVHLIKEYQLLKMQRLVLNEKMALSHTKQHMLYLSKRINANPITLPHKPLMTHLSSHNLLLARKESRAYEQLEAYITATRPLVHFGLTADEIKLLSLSPNSYTLQLMGVQDYNDLIKFIKNNHLENKGLIFRTYYLNQDWYVLLLGSFKDPTEALKAIETLPPPIRQLKPWIRTMASVQRTIQLYR